MDSELDEDKWILQQRAVAESYLAKEKLTHNGVADEPDWFVAPYVALWAIQSVKAPGHVGWWAISGDLPTDYISASDAKNARQAMQAFAKQWLKISSCLLRGEEHPTMKMGKPENRRELGDLLKKRAEIIARWAADESIW